MFAYKRSLIAVLTVLIAGFAFLIASQIVDEFGFAFWVNMAALWLAILFVGLSSMTLMKTDEKAMPMQYLPLFISFFYLGYVLIVPLFCLGPIGLVIAHCAGFLIALIVYVFSGMAHRNTVDLQESQKQAFAARTSFQNALAYFKMKYESKLMENKELNQKYLKLEDAIQYTCDSVPGSEDADEKIKSALQVLANCEDEQIAANLEELLRLVQWRQDIIKNLR